LHNSSYSSRISSHVIYLASGKSPEARWRAEARSKKGKSACGVYPPDLEQLRPPDVPPGMVKLRLVKKA
jgi:hypothetical protein